jgi:hypothetical protein
MQANRERLRAYNRQYDAAHPEATLEKFRRYHARHRDKTKAYDAQRKAEGRREHQLYPEKVRERLKKYYHEHWEEFRAYRESHKAEIAANSRQYYKNNIEKDRVRQHNRRARQAALPDTWNVEQQRFMLEYWQHRCAVCGNQEGLFWTLAYDHWIPLHSSDCPGTISTNMLPLCHGRDGCNNRKKNANAHDFLTRYFSSKKVIHIEQAIATYFALVAQTFP